MNSVKVHELLDEFFAYAYRDMPNDEIAVVIPLTFGRARICIGPAGDSPILLPGAVVAPVRSAAWYRDGWCYDTPEGACEALLAWDITKDPEPDGWMRHPDTGRRRPGGDKSKEYVNS